MLFFIPFMIGSCFCSFLGCLAQRWPKGLSITGRSHCDSCGKTLKAWQLIPVFGFLIQRGRCTFCHQKIDFTFWLSELLSGLLFYQLYIWTLSLNGWHPYLFFGWYFVLLFLSLMDHFYHCIYPLFLLPLLASSFFLNTSLFTTPHLISVVIVSCILALMSRTTKAMGWGDVELLSVIAFAFGLETMILTLLIGSGSALLWVGLRSIHNPPRLKKAIAFYPYLSLGLFFSLLYL